jgi:hypothetical protein
MVPRRGIVFEHLVGAPVEQVRRFSAVARAMVSSSEWRKVSTWNEPPAVLGETEAK